VIAINPDLSRMTSSQADRRAEIGEIPSVGKGSKRNRQKLKRRSTINRAALNAGRPRIAGDRYANGRLKPIGPNDRVVAERRALLGKPAAKGLALRSAEGPIELAFERGWLTVELYRAACTFREMHARSGLGAPRMKVSNPEPTVRSSAVLGVDPASLYYMAKVWDRLKSDQAAREALIVTVLLDAWPSWLLELIELTNDGWGAMAAEAYAVHPERHALRLGLAMVAAVTADPPPTVIGKGTDLSRFVEWTRSGGLRDAA
jgi:hypothetical protein